MTKHKPRPECLLDANSQPQDRPLCSRWLIAGSGEAGFGRREASAHSAGGHIATRTLAGIDLPYPDHDDVVYVVRVENQGDAPAEVTVRIFLGPQTAAADRRA